MKQVPLIVGVALLSSCASTRSVSQPAESVDPPAPAAAEATPVASATPSVPVTVSVTAPTPSATSPVAVAGQDSPASSRISIYLGPRGLDSRLWAPVEDQFALGVEYAQEAPDSVVGWEAGAFLAGDSASFGGVDVKSRSFEIYGGVRKTFGDAEDDWHPYVAGGLSLMSAEFELAGVSDTDSSISPYIHGGVLYDITESMYLGVDLRFLFGSSITLAGLNGDADYTQLAFVVGWLL